MKIILASASLRRRQLMEQLHLPFEIMVCPLDEVSDSTKHPFDQCLDISYQKALDIYNKTQGERIIIGADTMVIDGSKIYGKPKTKNDAKIMLRNLASKKHQVVTALSILVFKNGTYYEEKMFDVADVYIDDLTDEEINKWVLENDVCDMAGSYGIQTEFGKYISCINGNYYTIVGLPINLVYRTLKKYL